MLYDVNGLRALVLVANHGSFSAAARVLRLSTNAVSHRIAQLESRLGVRLFERTTRLVRTTPSGERVLGRARRIIEELELVEHDLSVGQLEGSVRVGLPPDLAGPALFAGIARLLEAAPRLNVQLFGRSSPVDPRKEALDLVVWGGPRERIPTELTARALGAVTWALCATPAYLARYGTPANPADLVHHRCLRALAPRPERTWTLVDLEGVEQSVDISGNIESDDPRVLLAALAQGLGIGIRPLVEVRVAVSTGAWAHVLPGWTFSTLAVSLVSPRGRLRVPSVRQVADVLEATLRDLTRLSAER